MPQPRIASEIDFIADYLEENLTALRYAAYGLTDEQARATPCASSLSIGGLLKHAIWVMNQLRVRRSNPSGERSVEDLQGHAGEFFGSFALTDDERFDDIAAAFERAQEIFIADVRASDPAADVVAPPEPWEGRNEPTPTVERFHLMHLIEEFARHAGHADIIREQVDGATAMALKFGVEGRAGNDFITPWRAPTAKS
ncbi:MAG: DUF664 domain-containing protein [Ornithinimicrobium sp.]